MRTISVRLDEGSEARLERLCQTLGLSQTEVVKAGPVLLQQHSTSPAALAEGLGLIGSFSSAAQEGGTTGHWSPGSTVVTRTMASVRPFFNSTTVLSYPLGRFSPRSAS